MASEQDGNNNHAASVYRLFGREKPIHILLGGGKPADIILWRNKKNSAVMFGVATAIYVVFELFEYHLLTLLCHSIILALAIPFLLSNGSAFLNKSPPSVPQVHIPEGLALQVASALRFEINRALAILRSIASGQDLKMFLAVISGLWILSIVGSFFNFLTLFYIAFVLLLTMPVLYEKNEDQVDAYAVQAMHEIRKQYAVLDAKYHSKLPKGPLKDKKAM